MDLTSVTWRKSTYSGGDNACVEVAELRKRPGAGQEEHAKNFGAGRAPASRRTDADRLIVMRDSKNSKGPWLYFTSAEWIGFCRGIKGGESDHLKP